MKKANITHWDELPLILNVKEVAQLTGCGEQMIRMLCHAKQIPCFRLGRAFSMLREGLRQWIEKISVAEISQGKARD
jgi:excisionase family DNA binding protein